MRPFRVTQSAGIAFKSSRCSELGALWSSASSRALRGSELSGACIRSLRCKLHGTKKKKEGDAITFFFFFFSCNTKKKQHKEKCLLGSCVGPAAVAPSSKLIPNFKLAPAPSRLQAPSSLPLNVSGARSSGDGVRGRGW